MKREADDSYSSMSSSDGFPQIAYAEKHADTLVTSHPKLKFSMRNRSSNWTEHDKSLAVRLIIPREPELYPSSSPSSPFRSYTNMQRKVIWMEVAAEFNKRADECRTPEQLKKAFENVRMQARKHCEENQYYKQLTRVREPPPHVLLLVDHMGDKLTSRPMPRPVHQEHFNGTPLHLPQFVNEDDVSTPRSENDGVAAGLTAQRLSAMKASASAANNVNNSEVITEDDDNSQGLKILEAFSVQMTRERIKREPITPSPPGGENDTGTHPAPSSAFTHLERNEGEARTQISKTNSVVSDSNVGSKRHLDVGDSDVNDVPNKQHKISDVNKLRRLRIRKTQSELRKLNLENALLKQKLAQEKELFELRKQQEESVTKWKLKTLQAKYQFYTNGSNAEQHGVSINKLQCNGSN